MDREHPGGLSPIGPVDPSFIPRYSGIATFAGLPTLEGVSTYHVAVMGSDTGVSFRPRARSGPAVIREASRLLGPRIVGADIVKVGPAYDHASMSAIAASHVAYEFISPVARPPAPRGASSGGVTP